MSRPLTIVMYHYVRDLARSRFPAIKGLSLDRFRRQLIHIRSHYTPVTVEEVMAAQASGDALPPNAILLTFDDGYSDHFLNVFPLLDEHGIQGVFFPPVAPIAGQTVMDVNKIQFVLASVTDPAVLLEQVFRSLDEFRAAHTLKTREEYLASVTEAHRYDGREIIVLKRLLQRELPAPVRSAIVARLFAEHVTCDESAFAAELYMSMDQIACMRRHGMAIGSHGCTHAWLNHIPPAQQADEVDRSLQFLDQLGVPRHTWTICYPYGGYDDSLLGIVRSRGGSLGFTVDPRVADLDADDPLTLPRLDTNDLPS
jgi:peptidoglycan/xylan/chitin deacetylase (PgdA/CDA1 family)